MVTRAKPLASVHAPQTGGRVLRTCLACGRISVGRYCPHCAHAVRKTYATPEYRANRADLLATATHCWICGGPPTPRDPLTADHVTSLHTGGGHDRANLQAAHSRCNKARGARMKIKT